MIVENCTEKELPEDSSDEESDGGDKKTSEQKHMHVMPVDENFKLIKRPKRNKGTKKKKTKKNGSEGSRSLSGGREPDMTTPFGKNLSRKKHYMYLRNKNVAPPLTKYHSAALYNPK
jgi:hypothetical protein